jgi:hypothetical protein
MRAAAALLLASCALDAGGPFASVSGALEVALVVPASRDAGGGWMKLDTSYQARLTRATLELGPVELVASAAAGTAFDPANPPPGYTLCHGGHCHAADGRLVSYADVAAQLAGGSGATVALAFTAPGTIDLLAGEATFPLTCGAPRCDLPGGTVALVRVAARRLVLEGAVRDPVGRITGEQPLAVTAEGALLAATVELPADRAHDPEVTLTLRAELGAQLLDSFAFDGGGDLAAHVRETLTETPLATDIRR